MAQPTRNEVAKFLRKFKQAAIGPPKNLEIWARFKNTECLIELGLNRLNRDDYLLELTPDNYCRGPENDTDSTRGGEVWFFGLRVNNQEIYIKLKVIEDEPFDHAVCLSFHRAEFLLQYPLRD